jgi:hypothetical protein
MGSTSLMPPNPLLNLCKKIKLNFLFFYDFPSLYTLEELKWDILILQGSDISNDLK